MEELLYRLVIQSRLPLTMHTDKTSYHFMEALILILTNKHIQNFTIWFFYVYTLVCDFNNYTKSCDILKCYGLTNILIPCKVVVVSDTFIQDGEEKAPSSSNNAS